MTNTIKTGDALEILRELDEDLRSNPRDTVTGPYRVPLILAALEAERRERTIDQHNAVIFERKQVAKRDAKIREALNDLGEILRDDNPVKRTVEKVLALLDGGRDA